MCVLKKKKKHRMTQVQLSTTIFGNCVNAKANEIPIKAQKNLTIMIERLQFVCCILCKYFDTSSLTISRGCNQEECLIEQNKQIWCTWQYLLYTLNGS